jgi:hypothetical protein
MNRNELTNRVAGFRPDDIAPPVSNKTVLISSPVSLPDHPAAIPELEDQNARMIRAWLQQPDISRIAAQCSWHLAEGHPLSGEYQGCQFYPAYTTQLALSYSVWEQQVGDIIGTRIGAIVVGTYGFQAEQNGVRYSAPFLHFYRIGAGKLESVRYFMGTARAGAMGRR